MMDIIVKDESVIIVTLGGVTAQLSRSEAQLLYESLKKTLGIKDNPYGLGIQPCWVPPYSVPDTGKYWPSSPWYITSSSDDPTKTGNTTGSISEKLGLYTNSGNEQTT